LKNVLVLFGNYANQRLQMADTEAAQAITDKWAVDATSWGSNGINSSIESGLNISPYSYPQSLVDFDNSFVSDGDPEEPEGPMAVTAVSGDFTDGAGGWFRGANVDDVLNIGGLSGSITPTHFFGPYPLAVITDVYSDEARTTYANSPVVLAGEFPELDGVTTLKVEGVTHTPLVVAPGNGITQILFTDGPYFTGGPIDFELVVA